MRQCAGAAPREVNGTEPWDQRPARDSLVKAADSTKAFDAILTAIGILAALIVIGTYLQLPLGGSMPSWAGCSYPLFTAYFALNGTALVFSMAAVFAVILGPYVLIRLQRANWRRQLVQLGFWHTTFSLCALMASFACAGLIRAGVDAPVPACANMLCEEGGVPCSPYSVRYTFDLPAASAASKSSPQVRPTSLADTDLLLDRTLVSLNRQLFADSTTTEHQDEVVVCHNYGLLAKTTSLDHTFLDGPVNSTFGFIVNKTCFALLGATAFKASFNGPKGHEVFRMDPRTLWCSNNQASVGHGWLPVTIGTALALLGRAGDVPGYIGLLSPNSPNDYYPPRPSDDMCPELQSVQVSVGVTQHLTLQAVELLTAACEHPSVLAHGGGQMAPSCHDAFMQYAGILGGPQALQLLCESSGAFNGGLCDNADLTMSNVSNWPLRGAVPYQALRFRCSSARDDTQPAVLCDYGVDPPLAVDAYGKYLGRFGALSEDGVVIFGSLRNHSVRWAVFFLLGLLVAVVFLSFMWLTVNFSSTYPMWYCTHLCRYHAHRFYACLFPCIAYRS